ncbi:MAG: PLP-dependent transferase, partial [Gemmatimonadota bacterium]
QMSGYGGVLAFDLAGGMDAVRPFLGALELAHRAASLGSVSTLVGPPATTSHVELSAEERAEAGIPEGLIRYSVGIEDADDLLADLACYPSMTGNTSLTEGSIVDLLRALDDCENPWACPHGRPVVIELDREEIE